MRNNTLAVVLVLACVVSAFSILLGGPAVRVTATLAAQDPAAIEASLGLERPTRRQIQQGLRNEGFDVGTPDGLFGPRTRGRNSPLAGVAWGAGGQMLCKKSGLRALTISTSC